VEFLYVEFLYVAEHSFDTPRGGGLLLGQKISLATVAKLVLNFLATGLTF
jgi:hypothetical protein